MVDGGRAGEAGAVRGAWGGGVPVGEEVVREEAEGDLAAVGEVVDVDRVDDLPRARCSYSSLLISRRESVPLGLIVSVPLGLFVSVPVTRAYVPNPLLSISP